MKEMREQQFIESTIKEDIEFWVDDYGVKYSLSRKKLISCPDELTNYRVLEGTEIICNDAFECCRSLKKVVFPHSLKLIGAHAFFGCTLKEITIPNSVTTIGARAFFGCDVERITIRNSGITTLHIGDGAFQNCESLKEVILCNPMITIGDYAFDGCEALQKIVIPCNTRNKFEKLMPELADKIVETPNGDIPDKIMEAPKSETCIYAQQAVRQMIYNQWRDGVGYVEEVGLDFSYKIENRSTQEELILSDDYLTLSKSIIESCTTKYWERFEETWDKFTQICTEEVQSIADKTNWFGEFDKRCDEYFYSQFREYGVVHFFESQRHEQCRYAQTIRCKIEKKLFDEWESGAKGILEIEKYTQLLITDCTKRIGIFEQQKVKMKEELTNISENIQEINLRWNESLFVRVFNFIPKLGMYKDIKSRYYSITTYVVAYEYAKELLQEIIVELNNMFKDILSFKNELYTIMQKVVDMGLEHKVGQQFIISNRDKISTIATTIRTRMVQNIGKDDDHTFTNLYNATNSETIRKIIFDVIAVR